MLNEDFHLFLAKLRLEIIQRESKDLLHFYFLPRQISPLHPGVLQQIIDQRIHAFCGMLYAFEKVQSITAQSVCKILHQNRGKALHTPKRRPKIMRDGVTERLELLGGPQQFSSSCGHTRFQGFILGLSPLLLFLLIGDVADDLCKAMQPTALVRQRVHEAAGPKPRAIFATVPALIHRPALGPCPLQLLLRDIGRTIRFHKNFCCELTAQFPFLESKHLLSTWVAFDVITLLIEQQEAKLRGILE